MIARLSLTLAVLAGPLATAGAAELVIRDLQADVLLPPTAYTFTLDTPGGDQTGSDGFSSGSALCLGGRYSLSRSGDAVGLVGGADLEAAGYTSSDTNLFDLGGRLSLGVGWAITDTWVVTLMGGYALGQGRFTADASNGAPQLTVRGPYHGEDLRLDLQYHVSRAFALDLGGGYWRDTHRLSGDASTLELQRSGGFVGIGFIWRLQSSPVRLE